MHGDNLCLGSFSQFMMAAFDVNFLPSVFQQKFQQIFIPHCIHLSYKHSIARIYVSVKGTAAIPRGKFFSINTVERLDVGGGLRYNKGQ